METGGGFCSRIYGIYIDDHMWLKITGSVLHFEITPADLAQ